MAMGMVDRSLMDTIEVTGSVSIQIPCPLPCDLVAACVGGGVHGQAGDDIRGACLGREVVKVLWVRGIFLVS